LCSIHPLPFEELGGDCPAEGQQKLANFFPCAENAAGGHSDFADALPCAKKFGLDVQGIQKCYDPSDTAYDSTPVKVIDLLSNVTEKANPKVQYFPDVRVNGKQLKNPTAEGLIKMVCDAYTGTDQNFGCHPH
jgi:hypothetical protein